MPHDIGVEEPKESEAIEQVEDEVSNLHFPM